VGGFSLSQLWEDRGECPEKNKEAIMFLPIGPPRFFPLRHAMVRSAERGTRVSGGSHDESQVSKSSVSVNPTGSPTQTASGIDYYITQISTLLRLDLGTLFSIHLSPSINLSTLSIPIVKS